MRKKVNFYLLLVVFLFGCTINRSGNSCNKKTSDVFRKISRHDLDKKTFINGSSHFSDNGIDIFSRGLFLRFMINTVNYNYDDFYLIEIYEKGEYNQNINILVINYQNAIYYHFYKRHVDRWIEESCPNYYSNIYDYNKLNNLCGKLNYDKNKFIYISHYN